MECWVLLRVKLNRLSLSTIRSISLCQLRAITVLNIFPLLGAFDLTKKCENLRIIFYDLASGTFKVGNIACTNYVNIKSVNGRFDIRTCQSHVEKEISDKKELKSFRASINYDLMVVFKSFDLENNPNCPGLLKTFNKEIIPENFDPAIGQKYVTPTTNVQLKGFYKHGTGIVEQYDKEQDTFAVIESGNILYAVPISKECICTVVESTLHCECQELNYEYCLYDGTMTVGNTKLFTNNIRGNRIIINNSLENLISEIKQEFEAKV